MFKTALYYLLSFYSLLVKTGFLISSFALLLHYGINNPEIIESAREQSQKISIEVDENKVQYSIIVGSISIGYVVTWFALRNLNNKSQYKNSRAARIRRTNTGNFYKLNSDKESKLEDYESDTSSLYKPEESISSDESMDRAKEDTMLTNKYLKYAYEKPDMQVYKEADGEPCELNSESESDSKLSLTEEQISKMDPETRFTARVWFNVNFKSKRKDSTSNKSQQETEANLEEIDSHIIDVS